MPTFWETRENIFSPHVTLNNHEDGKSGNECFFIKERCSAWGVSRIYGARGKPQFRSSENFWKNVTWTGRGRVWIKTVPLFHFCSKSAPPKFGTQGTCPLAPFRYASVWRKTQKALFSHSSTYFVFTTTHYPDFSQAVNVWKEINWWYGINLLLVYGYVSAKSTKKYVWKKYS